MATKSESTGWIRPMGKFESYLEGFHQKGIMMSSYCLTLNSKNPLEEDQVKKALIHLWRKVPSLSVCIRLKNENEMWFHEIEEENVDFQILENVDDIHKEFEEMSKRHYNSFDGPLWRARLIPQPLDSSCALPEVQLLYPHQYVFLFGFHHSMTDGTSNLKICNSFLALLNSVIAGDDIDDSEKLGELVSTEKTEKLAMEIGMKLRDNDEEVMRLKEMLLGGIDDLLFIKAFPPPNNSKGTLSLGYTLPKEETSRFLRRCRQEGVTIHTGFCSVINAAIAEMLKNAGVEKETYTIKAYHTVNTRRYWEGDSSKALGAHLLPLCIVSDISGHLDVEEFWKQAKAYHSTFFSKLENKAPLKEIAVVYMFTGADTFSSAQSKGISVRPFYYGTTNMGNMSSIFTGEGEHVQVTDFKRTTSTSDSICSHVMQTFRGRFIYSLDYDQQFMSQETAQLYVNTIFKVLREVINSSK